MIFVGFCGGGERVTLPEAVSVEINRELYVPADDLTVVFRYSDGFPSLRKICAFDDKGLGIEYKNVIFTGVVDEQLLNITENGALVKIVARSMAALLLDNECAPIKYKNPDIDVICKKHLEPFGIGFENKNIKCRSGELSVSKGNSHYKVLEKFCEEFLYSTPIIDGRGICRFNVFDDVGSISFDNENGVEFRSISICENMYKRISKVYVSGNNGYDTIINDYESISLGIVRERYLNLASSKTNTLSDADNIIKNGRIQSLSASILCDGCLVDIIGYNASIGIEVCKGKSFVVSQIKYTADIGGEQTRVKLTAQY